MKILMLTESNFPGDIRVKREAYTLVKQGYDVSIIALKKDKERFYETIHGVKVYRMPKIELFKHGKQTKSANPMFFVRSFTLVKALIGYGIEYLYFTIGCFFVSLFVLMKNKFDVVHTHNPPDTLFIVALFYKLFGKKFVYDHHDLCPELFMEKYGTGKNMTYKILLFLEKISCRFADIVIATNESYKSIEIERCAVKPENIFVVRYGPDLGEMKITHPIEDIRSRGKTVLCYLGAVNIQDGVDYLLVTLSKLINKYDFKDVLLLMVGDGDYLENIKILAHELKLMNHIIFTGFIYERNELNRYLSTADIFVDSAPYSFLNDNSTFIKHMEYMIYGKPIVSFKLKESMFSLNNAGVFIPPNDTEKMAMTIIELINDEQRMKKLGENAKKRVQELSWDKVSMPLIEGYKSLAL